MNNKDTKQLSEAYLKIREAISEDEFNYWKEIVKDKPYPKSKSKKVKKDKKLKESNASEFAKLVSSPVVQKIIRILAKQGIHAEPIPNRMGATVTFTCPSDVGGSLVQQAYEILDGMRYQADVDHNGDLDVNLLYLP